MSYLHDTIRGFEIARVLPQERFQAMEEGLNKHFSNRAEPGIVKEIVKFSYYEVLSTIYFLPLSPMQLALLVLTACMATAGKGRRKVRISSGAGLWWLPWRTMRYASNYEKVEYL